MDDLRATDVAPRPRLMVMGERGVVRITSAPKSRAEDLGSRQRAYMISMGIRVICLLLAVVVGPGVLRWVALAGAVFLPYVAVVMANAVETRSDDFALPDLPGDRELTAPPEPPSDRVDD